MCFLLDKISNTEYNMMEFYRNWYAWCNERSSPSERTYPIRDILSDAWAKNKEILYELLGNNLMISKEFHYEKSLEELQEAMGDMIDGIGTYGRNHRAGRNFIRRYRGWIRDTYHEPSMAVDPDTWECVYVTEEDRQLAEKIQGIKQNLHALVSDYVLAQNRYEGPSFTIKLKNDKDYIISNGCKPMKVLAKIADAYELEGFEDFRICHSLVHNQKKLFGDITLSIHPLDYWTMSDNECGWESCMSWQETGCYRQGTVEMMNSPCVIVAYLSAAEEMKIGSNTWNNKKWRQLFIVDKDVILGIKSYPYRNDNISIAIIKWLKELAEQNMDWKYFGDSNGEPLKYSRTPITNPEHPDDTRKIHFYFHSNMMYTDIGHINWHPMYVGTHLHENDESMRSAYKTNYYDTPVLQIDYNYSGPSQCMSCGQITNSFESEMYLCCVECEETVHCEECGNVVDSSNYFALHGIILCDDCWNNYVSYCSCCHNPEFDEDMFKVRIIVPVSKEYKEHYLRFKQYPPTEGCESVLVFDEEFTIPVCISHVNHLNKFLKPDAKIYNMEINEHYYVENTVAISVDDLELDNCNNWIFDQMPYGFQEQLRYAQQTNDYDAFAKYFSSSISSVDTVVSER